MTRRTAFITSLFVAACAHATQPGSSARRCDATATPRAAAERIAKDGTVLDLYFRQDGVWLSGAPIMVNEEFDFMLATTMEDGMGAGLAAAKRKQSNEKRAKDLGTLALSERAREHLEQLRCCGREVYFVLWGPSTLKVVVDHNGEVGRGVIAEEQVAAEMDGEGIAQAAWRLLQGLDCGS
jgi:hypothetical protein